MATRKGQQQMQKISQKYVTDIVQAGMSGKAPKLIKYIRKWRGAQTGEMRYEYRNTGYMGGTPRRVGGRRTQSPTS